MRTQAVRASRRRHGRSAPARHRRPSTHTGVVGVGEQLAVAGRVAVRPQLDGGAAAVVLVEPGVEAGDLLRPAAVAADERRRCTGRRRRRRARWPRTPSTPRPLGRAGAGRRRTTPTRARRRVPGAAVPAQPGQRVGRSQSRCDRRRRTSTAGRLDVGDRPPGERGVRRERLQRVAVTPGERRRRRAPGRGAARRRPAACRRRGAGTARRSRASSPCRRRRRRRRRRRSSAGTAAIVAGRSRRRSRRIDVADVQYPGQLFDTTSGSATSMPGDDGAEHAERHRQAVVVVGRQRGAVQRPAGLDAQPVGLDGRRRRRSARSSAARSPRRSLSLARMNPTPVIVVGVDGRRGDGGERRHEVGDVGHVDVDARAAASPGRARPTSPSASSSTRAAHRGRAGRRTRRRPGRTSRCRPRTCDPPAGDGGHGQRVARRRGVGLDRRARSPR